MDFSQIGLSDEKRKQKTMTILPSVFDDFKKIAETKGKSVSRLVEDFMKQYSNENKKASQQ